MTGKKLRARLLLDSMEITQCDGIWDPSAENLKALVAFEFDVLILHSINQPGERMLKVSRFGVWTHVHRHVDVPAIKVPGFRESIWSAHTALRPTC